MPFDATHRPDADLAAASPVKEDVEHLAVKIRQVLFANPDNGYFIAEVEVEGETQAPDHALRASRFGAPVVLVKGESPSFTEHANQSVGQSLSVAGQWDEDARGAFFRVLFTQESIPTTREALAKYLADGRLKGIGAALAKRLMDQFGMDLLRVLDHDPGRLATVSGITEQKAKAIADAWRAKRDQFRVVSFLGVHGIGESLAKRVADTYGQQDLEDRIRQNPYLLTEVDGIGFKKADDVAMSLGLPIDSPLRIRAALLDVLHAQVQNGGNTAVPVRDWVQAAMAFVAQPQRVVEEHCKELVASRQVVLRKIPVARQDHGQVMEVLMDCASPFRLGLKERRIAQTLLGQLKDVIDPEKEQAMVAFLMDPKLGLDPSQREAALLIARNRVAILTGGPGTGKTTTLRSVVKAMELAGLTVVLAAPTGRAAKRMEEAIGRPAATIHRTLEFKGSLGFTCNRSNPLHGDVFILDESSMVDTSLMDAWLDAIPPHSQLLFVGDADQLPSVGPGNLLRDMIDSRQVPTARLTTVHRNGGLIAKTAQQVLAGRAPTHPADPWVDTFAFVPAQEDDEVVEKVTSLITGFVNQGQDPSSIQVLVPQKEGTLGTKAFNEALRPYLSLDRTVDWANAALGARKFIKGDRVMQVRNDYQREVFNGDLGHVIEASDDGFRLLVEMEGGARVEYKKEHLKDLELGFAQTVHKSQGGERPIIIMVCVNKHSFSLYRNLLYTGITRGKDRVMVVGHAKAVALASHKVEQALRLTGLRLELDNVKRLMTAPVSPDARPVVRRPAP